MTRTNLVYFFLAVLNSMIAAATELSLDRRSKFTPSLLDQLLLRRFIIFQPRCSGHPHEILNITNEVCIVPPCFSIHSSCTNCCGNFCCAPEDDCIGGRCRIPPPPPPTTVAPVVTLAEWAPNGCVTNDDGTVSCHDEAPRYQIKGSSFSDGNVDVGIYYGDGTPVWTTTVQSVYVGGSTGATITVNTDVLDCDGDPNGLDVKQAWVKTTDVRTGFASNQLEVFVGCLFF